ncbi:hypothetical protein [Kitasatospora sp. MBT66]|uniref:hypothetical protein n=1 Tax=Kitasatospora sp. MBT66 TaxID=1444769 RepID=UPI00068A596E|nr:hypothetical protein [Kitasatospora sp. MBT66]
MNQPHQPEPATTPTADEQPPGTLREAATRQLHQLTAPGGRLDRLRRDLLDATDDWDSAERWVRVLAYLVGTAAAVLLLGTVGGILLNGAAAVMGAIHLPEHIPGSGDGLRAAITGPIHTYLASHLPAPLTEATAYGTWKTVGLIVAVLSFASQTATWRLAWSCWSAATLAMVWNATPEPGRTVAVGITAAAIAAASAVALRGLSVSLRPMVISRTEVHPQIVVQAPPEPKPAPARLASLPNPPSPFDHRR